MSKYRLTILSPVHISSGKEFELSFNSLEHNGFIYFYDEFSIVDFFIANNIIIPTNLDSLKRLIEQNKSRIIDSNLHFRKIESRFSKFDKPIFEHINTSYNPIISGSSIKGSIRTAILDCLYSGNVCCDKIKNIMKNKNLVEDRLNKNEKVPFDKDFANIFRFLKVNDSSVSFDTKIYKTINIKKEKEYQEDRKKKIESISNYIEAIKPNQTFEIEIKDTSEKQIFEKIGNICNKFYKSFFNMDEDLYATKNEYLQNKIEGKELSNNTFLINIGRFSGAEMKTLNNIRYILAVDENDKSKTTARTFALESDTVKDRVYFENELLPFGWVLCEKIEKFSNLDVFNLKDKYNYRFDAIDTIHKIQKDNIERRKRKEKEELEVKVKREAEMKAKREAMSPIERLIDDYQDIAILINDMKNGKIENLEEIKYELALKIKEKLKENPKTWDKAKQKALKRKEYIESILESKE